MRWRRGKAVCENGEFWADSRQDAHNCPRGRAACPYSCGRAFPALPPALREGTRDAVEARDDGAAALNDGRSPPCHAYRLCRASFPGFGSGRALLAAWRGWGKEVGRAHGGLMGIHGHPPLCMLRNEDAQRRNGSCGLLPARPSSYRSAYGLVGVL